MYKRQINDNRIFIADSNNIESLVKLTSKTKVICTTVGPYAKYGTNLVEACIRSCTDYCDITGETQWIRRIIDKYDKMAEEKKIKIINSCGFDSVPSDMGVYYSQKRIFEKTGEYASMINMRVAGAKGGISGGTYNSLSNVLEEARIDNDVRKTLINPYGLNPDAQQYGPDKQDLQKVIFEISNKCKGATAVVQNKNLLGIMKIFFSCYFTTIFLTFPNVVFPTFTKYTPAAI